MFFFSFPYFISFHFISFLPFPHSFSSSSNFKPPTTNNLYFQNLVVCRCCRHHYHRSPTLKVLKMMIQIILSISFTLLTLRFRFWWKGLKIHRSKLKFHEIEIWNPCPPTSNSCKPATSVIWESLKHICEIIGMWHFFRGVPFLPQIFLHLVWLGPIK